MPQDISIVNDLKTAAVLAGSAGLLGAATVPFLLPSISELVPPEQRTLPLPLPLFCVALAIQFLLFYGLLALAGLRLAGGATGNLPPCSVPSGPSSVRTASACRPAWRSGRAFSAGSPWSAPSRSSSAF